MRVFVLLFNARTENEGIHTVQSGSGRQKVLMFQNEDDATRYALMLEAQDFPEPTVEALEAEEIEEFCRSAGYEWELVADDMLAVPPESNVEQTDWQPEGQEQPEEQKLPEQTPSDVEDPELEAIRRRLEGLL